MDYEQLYNALQEETKQMKEENDELFSEYESTIKLLSEAVDKYKEEKQTIEKQYIDINEKHKAMNKDLESFKEKNRDKMKDIELLNKQVDSLQRELIKVTEAKGLLDSKIVTLENDNDHFLTKLRENEATIEDLNSKLESALEENISLQNDFEEFKLTTEEQLQRKADELEEAKNEIISKEKALSKEISHNKKRKKRESKRDLEKSKAKDDCSVSEVSLMKNSTSKMILPILNDKEIYDMTRLSSNSFFKKDILNNCTSIRNEDSIIDLNNKSYFGINSFSFEYQKQKRRKSSREKKGKLGEDVVENIKEILSKIQERKKTVLSQKAIISTKLDKIGIKVN